MLALTPKQIVSELDRYIVGQDDAKRSSGYSPAQPLPGAIGFLRISGMRLRLKISLMSGSYRSGKTEVARRIAKITGAPFVKVEATKFTEVGYVGRDVDSMVRDCGGLHKAGARGKAGSASG